MSEAGEDAYSLQREVRVETRDQIVEDDPRTARHELEPPRGVRLHDVEQAEQKKAARIPGDRERNEGERDELACRLVDHDRVGILEAKVRLGRMRAPEGDE